MKIGKLWHFDCGKLLPFDFFFIKISMFHTAHTLADSYSYTKKRIVANTWIKTPTQDLHKSKPVNNSSMG